MHGHPITRRRFLLLGGALLAAPSTCLRRAFAQAPTGHVIRMGMILPPERGGTSTEDLLRDAVTRAARMGALLAEEETAFNAELLGMSFELRQAEASSAEAAVKAARKLVVEDEVNALMGGFGEGVAEALNAMAAEVRIPFFNIGSAKDTLRGENCSRYTFHVEASAAMYLDALAGWFIREAHRHWFFVYEDSDEGQALYRRALTSVTKRHFGARESGRVAVRPGQSDYSVELDIIRRARPDLVILLISATDQLMFIEQYDAAGLEARVTGFPYPATQTRQFFRILRDKAPRGRALHRTTLWETSLDAYGARELNSRFMRAWARPMDPSAWAAYIPIKILFETAMFAGAVKPTDIIRHLENPRTVFDVWKGIGTSFRPWDHQLRQSLYLVRVSRDAPPGDSLMDQVALAILVGELPAIYMPGTDPVERLDQLGDLQGDSKCRF